MQINVSEIDRRVARKVHRLFSTKPHSEHIASECALAHLAAVLRTEPIESVLEFGAGIGTATYLILSNCPEAKVDCTENTPLCLDELEANIPAELRARLNVHSNGQLITGPFDLVITDGGTNVTSLIFKEGSVCFAEGSRRKARAKIAAAAERQGLTCRFTEYSRPYRVLRWRPLNLLPWRRLKPIRFRIVPYFKWKKEKGCWIGQFERLEGKSRFPPT